jgi:hypothetical protein
MLFLRNTRVVGFMVLLLCALYAPFYVTGIVALLISLRWRAWEVVGIGVCMDLLWMPSVGTFLGAIPLAACTALFIVWILEPFRRNLLLHT